MKVGRAAPAGRLLKPIVEALLVRGAAAVVLACAEVPIALDAVASPLRDAMSTRTVRSRAHACACGRNWPVPAARVSVD